MKLLTTCFLFLTALIIAGCESEESENRKPEINLTDSLKTHGIELIKEIKARHTIQDFFYMYDEVADIGWYDVKIEHENNERLGIVWLRISNFGDIEFASVYWGNPIYHTRMEIQIGDKILSTEDIPLHDESNVRERGISETVWYNNRDNGVLNALATTSSTNDLEVILHGANENFAFPINKKDIEKIKDAIEFARIIKILEIPAEKQEELFGL